LRATLTSSLLWSSRQASPAVAEPGAELVAADVEQGPHAMVGPGRHAGQPPGTGPAHQSKQHGFRLVATRVGDGHDISLQPPEGVPEELEAGVPAGNLHRMAAGAGTRRHIRVGEIERQPEAQGQSLHEVRIGVGLVATDMVVQVRDASQPQQAAAAARASRTNRRATESEPPDTESRPGPGSTHWRLANWTRSTRDIVSG
jgi:hypothetical protein